jgi:hypothetical protein
MSNLPNLSNYEEWLINQLEGLLNDEETALLMDFLSLHPNIKAEFDLLSQTDLALETHEASLDFSYLKKEAIDTLTPAQETQLIALLEGDLTPQEIKEVEREIAIQPAFKKAYSLFELTKLKPSQVEFKGKDKLKRKEAKRIAMLPMQWIALAATLLLFGYGSWVLLTKQQEVKPILAATNSEIDPKRISEPKTYPQVKTIEAAKVLQQSNSQTKEKLLVSTEELNQLSINPLSLKATSVKLALPELKLVSLSTLTNAIVTEPILSPKFLKPSEWLVQQVKKNIPLQALAAADTISKGGAGNLALNLLNRTTGISMESYAKEDDPRRRVAFVSKFFSYERVTYQKN